MFIRLWVFAVVFFGLTSAHAKLLHLECKDIPEVYKTFKDRHAAKLDLSLAPLITSAEAFYKGIESDFLKKLDPHSTVLIEEDVKDFIADVSSFKKVLEEQDCSRFDKVAKRFEEAKARVWPTYEAYLLRPDLRSQILEESKKHLSLSRESIRQNLMKLSAKVAHDKVELEKNRFNHLLFNYLDNRIALAKISTDVEGDAYLASVKAVRRFFTVEDEVSTAEYMLKAGFSGADPHSEYLTYDAYQNFLEMRNPDFIGLGASIVDGGRGIYVQEVVRDEVEKPENTILKNDLIVKINERSTAEMSLKDFFDNSYGIKGTSIAVELIRKGKPHKLVLKRVKANRLKNNLRSDVIEVDGKKIGYLKLSSFVFEDTASEMRKRMRAMQLDFDVDGWVLDLRDNGGGLIQLAIDVAGIFLGPDQLVVRVVDTKIPLPYLSLPTNPHIDETFTQPMVVLTSKNSASASEIAASALQIHGRALVISDSPSTFRKGTIQMINEFKLNDKIRGGVKLTHGYFYDINGVPLQKRGVESDILVPVAGEVGEQFDETKMEGVLPTPANLSVGEEIVGSYKRDRAPMQEFAQRTASSYGADFVNSMKDKDVVLEAGQRVVVDIIKDETLNQIRTVKQSKQSPTGLMFPDFRIK